jgi:hypothetical protein
MELTKSISWIAGNFCKCWTKKPTKVKEEEKEQEKRAQGQGNHDVTNY